MAQQIEMIQNAIKTKKSYWNEMKLPRFNYKVSNEDEEIKKLCQYTLSMRKQKIWTINWTIKEAKEQYDTNN